MNWRAVAGPTFGRPIAVGSALFVVCVLAIWHWLTVLPTAVGLVLVAVAFDRESRLLLGAAVWWLMLVVIGAIFGDAPIAVVFSAAVACVLAWDAGERGLTLGGNLGTRARTGRVEGLHAAATVFVGVASASVVAVGAEAIPGTLPPLAVLLAGVSAVVLLYVYDVSP